MGQPEVTLRADCGDRSFGRRLPTQLQPAFVEHSQPAGAYWVSECLKAPVGVDRHVPLQVEGSGKNFLPGGSPFGKPKVFHKNQFGGSKAVVHLGHCQLRAWVGYPGLPVSVLGASNDFWECGEVVSAVDCTRAVSGD